MERPTCKTCPYWKQIEDAELYGECRRYPATEGNRLDVNCDPGSVSIKWGHWFDQEENDWCGEHPDFPAYILIMKGREAYKSSGASPAG